MRNLFVLAVMLCACSSALVPVRCDSDANCAPGTFCGGDKLCAALPQCAPGTSLCGHACVALATDTANCGACGNVCPPPAANGAAACSASACTVTCASPYVKTGAACTVAAPGGVAAVGGQRQVTVSWSAVAGATSYGVRRATASGGPYTHVAATPSLSAVDRDLSPGTRYFYVVRAADASGQGPASAESSALTVPDAPGGLTATGGGSSIALAWTAAPGADSYRVLRAGGDGVFAQLAAPSTTSYTDAALADGATFTYEVQAVNASGASPASAPATASTAPIPVAPAITAPASVMTGGSGTASISPRPGMTYAWTIAGGSFSGASSGASVAFVAGPPGTLTLSCVETNATNHSSRAGSATVRVLPQATLSIGGTVTGLSGAVVLQNTIDSGTPEALTVSSNGAFAFPTMAASGSSYAVTVSTQPSSPAQTCVVTAGSGTATADVTTVRVDCPPFVVASGLDSPTALALNGSTLYFAVGLHPGVADCNTTNPAAGNRVMMVPSAGGTPTMIDYVDNVAGNCGIYGMVFDSSSIYWANYSDGVIKRATLAGASPSVVYTGPSYMNALSLGGSNLYYHSYPNRSLGRVTTGGTGNTTFANTTSINGENLTTDSSYLYWTDYSAGTVNKVPFSASPPASPIILATGETTPAAPFVTSSAIYWLQLGSSGALRYAPFASSTAASLNTTPLPSPGSFVVDANYAWVLASGTAPNYADGRIYRIPVGGGAPVIVAQGLYQPSSIAMDAGHLYWCNNSTTQTGGTRNSDGTIMMIAK